MHESSAAIILGFLFAILVKIFAQNDQILDYFRFDETLFFTILLPFIVFSAGFNMKWKKFFEHFNYVALFGVFGTICCFILFSTFNIIAFELFDFEQINLATGETSMFKL